MDITLYNSVIDRTMFFQGVYEDKLSQKKKVKDTVERLKDEKEILNKTEKVIKFLMDKLVKKDLSKMDALISYGLKSVYTNRDVVFKSEIIERGKKIWIDLQTISEGKVIDYQSQSSVHVIESFLLRILCIIKLKRARLLLLDETFAAVDPGYKENLSQLIVQLCNKLGINILFVTHDMGFIDYSKSSYRISRADNKTEVKQIK